MAERDGLDAVIGRDADLDGGLEEEWTIESHGGGRREGRAGGQALWTLVDQTLSSVANFGLAIAVARAVNQEIAGAFAYAFVVFSFALALMHGICTDALVIRFSAVQGSARHEAVRRASGASVLVGLGAAALCVVGGLVVGGALELALLLLACVLPGHFLQDSLRSAAFASGDARRAAAMDAVRAVLQFSAIGVCVVAGTADLRWYMASWALGVWGGSAVGMVQAGLPDVWSGGISWLRENARLSLRLGSNVGVSMGSFTVVMSLLAAVLGLVATGGLRFAQTILGPVQLLFGAVVSFMTPLLVRRLAARGPLALRRPTVVVSLGCVAFTAVVVGVLLALPDAAGRELLGESWDDARRVLIPIGVMQGGVAVLLCAGLPLKAMGRAGLLLRATAVQAVFVLALPLLGAAFAGVDGAAWGLALSQWVGALLTAFAAARVLREGDGGAVTA
ncbi:UNVERIFIED_ORG: hypothetical protein E4P37_19130 [Bacillus sp. AZ43]